MINWWLALVAQFATQVWSQGLLKQQMGCCPDTPRMGACKAGRSSVQVQYVSSAAHMADGGRVGVYVAQVRQLMRLRQLPQPVKQLRSPAQPPRAALRVLLPSAAAAGW